MDLEALWVDDNVNYNDNSRFKYHRSTIEKPTILKFNKKNEEWHKSRKKVVSKIRSPLINMNLQHWYAEACIGMRIASVLNPYLTYKRKIHLNSKQTPKNDTNQGRNLYLEIG